MDGGRRRDGSAGAARTAWVRRAVARRWLRIADLDPQGQRRALGDVAGVAFSVPLALGALGWLIAASDLALLQQHWPHLIVLVAASALLSAVPFIWFLERRAGTADWIQASFLPQALPRITGWQLAAALRPARQTSGDFYDVVDLPGDRVGLVVADVADKGTGAALFMALTRTLLRTYARAHPDSPALVLAATNQRMLEDAQSSMFVTAFYAVLDLATGVLHYANAGQNPPLLYAPGAAQPRRLVTTGIPLGIEGAFLWGEQTVHLAPGATLVLYSDGVTEAQNQQGDFYEEARLIASIAAAPNRMVQALLDSILCQLAGFVGDATQADDITLLVLSREPAGAADSQQ